MTNRINEYLTSLYLLLKTLFGICKMVGRKERCYCLEEKCSTTKTSAKSFSGVTSLLFHCDKSPGSKQTRMYRFVTNGFPRFITEEMYNFLDIFLLNKVNNN